MAIDVKEWRHNLGILADGTGIVKGVDIWEECPFIAFITKEATDIAKEWDRKIGVLLGFTDIIRIPKKKTNHILLNLIQ